MSHDLLVPLLLTTLPVLHHPGRGSPNRVTRRKRAQIVNDIYANFWGGLPGFTPRQDEEEQALENAVLSWANALNRHPDIARLGLQRR